MRLTRRLSERRRRSLVDSSMSGIVMPWGRWSIRSAARDGSIDLLFNNAGLAMGGPTHELTGQHWDCIIDVNIRGVVNGVLTAYPRMIERGYGGVGSTPRRGRDSKHRRCYPPTPATKHAVVGLSTGLRPEASAARCSSECPVPGCGGDCDPRSVALPATYRRQPRLPSRHGSTCNRCIRSRSPRTASPRAALGAIARNKAIIVVPRSTEGAVVPPPSVACPGRADQPIDSSDRHPRSGPARIGTEHSPCSRASNHTQQRHAVTGSRLPPAL